MKTKQTRTPTTASHRHTFEGLHTLTHSYTFKSINMADLRRRKPDDDGGKQLDDDTFGASKVDRRIGDGSNGSDDEQQPNQQHQSHHKKSSSTLTTADSSDHVNISRIYFCLFFYFDLLDLVS